MKLLLLLCIYYLNINIILAQTFIPIPDTPNEILDPTSIINNDIVYDNSKLANLAISIKKYRELIDSKKGELDKLNMINNEINGLRGQLSNIYNQSFGIIGETLELYESINNLINNISSGIDSIKSNISCLKDDITELQKFRTLLKAKNYDYYGESSIDDLIGAYRARNTPYSEFSYTGYNNQGIYNMSNCGNIKKGNIALGKAKEDFDEVNQIIERLYLTDTKTGKDLYAEYKSKTKEDISNILTDIKNNDTNLITLEQYKRILLQHISHMMIEYKQNVKEILVLELQESSKSIYDKLKHEIEKVYEDDY